MRRSILYVLVISFLTAGGFAQSNGTEVHPKAWGRVFFAPGVEADWGETASFFAVGTGADVPLFESPLAVSLELAYLAPFSAAGTGLGAFSPGASYSFGHGRTRPFATGGYTLLFRDETASGFYLGGGVNHWMSELWGPGVEVRDAVFSFSDANTHFVQFRANLLLH